MTNGNTLRETNSQANDSAWIQLAESQSHYTTTTLRLLFFLSTLISSPELREDIRRAPRRSTMMELPSSRENPISTQGKKGAWKLSRPKKFILTLGFRLLQMYTSMMVKAWPRNTRLTKVPNIWRPVKNLTEPIDHTDVLNQDRPLNLGLHSTPQTFSYTGRHI